MPADRGILVHSEQLCGYAFGDQHPMRPGRVRHTLELAQRLGVLDGLRLVEPGPADDDLVATVHTRDYIAAVQAQQPDPRFGVGTVDNPVVPGMHEIAARIVRATTDAARLVWTGEATRAANISGGLHHAAPSATSGFCVYNDLAVAIRWLLGAGARRVAYVDLDVHHGDGVQQIFYDDPRVLTISLHETPQSLFPGTGYPREIGGPAALGSAINVALPADTDDAGWLRAFHAVVPQALTSFAPDVIVSQHGCDTHRSDPLADLALTVDGQRAGALAVAELADRLCEGRWVATGGGGYSVLTAVPRAWTHLLAVVAGAPLDPGTAIPQDWRDLVGAGAPEAMTDGSAATVAQYRRFEAGYDPASALDQAILATRRAVFPELGLDPDPY